MKERIIVYNKYFSDYLNEKTNANVSLVWQKQKTISKHIGNIFKEDELQENMVVRNFRTTTQHAAIVGETQSRDVNLYNLDVIISVGYRVKSKQGTQFRIWATQRLVEQYLAFAETMALGNSPMYMKD